MSTNKLDPASRVKSAEFLTGYIYNELERAFFKQNRDKKREEISLSFETTFPNVWLTGNFSGLINSDDVFKLTVIKNMIGYHILNGFPLDVHDVEITWQECGSYHMKFKVDITPVPRKKMTVKEIEKALGYKIEIVE